MSTLFRNVAGQRVGAQLWKLADGTDFTDTVSVFVRVDGTAFAAGLGTVQNAGNGAYDYLPTQAETNGYDLRYQFRGTGAQTVSAYYKTVFGDYDGAIWIDTDDANTNTVIGVDGTRQKPVSTAAAARTLAEAPEIGVKQYRIAGTAALLLDNSDYTGWTFVGTSAFPTLDLNNRVTQNAIFRNLLIKGTMPGATTDGIFERCIIASVTSMRGGYFAECLLEGTLELSNAVLASFLDCYSGTGAEAVTFDVGNKDQVNIVGHNGKVILTSVTGASTQVNVGYKSGDELEIQASCTNGTVHIAGPVALTDNSAGTTVDLSAAALIGNGLTKSDPNDAPRLAAPTQETLGEQFGAVVSGTVDATPAPTTMQFAATRPTGSWGANADHYKGRTLIFAQGTRKEEATVITASTTSGAEVTLTVEALTQAPVAGQQFVMV